MRQRHLVSESQRFTVVWQPYQRRSPTGRELQSPVAFPFLLEGDEDLVLESGRPARLDGPALITGILVAFRDPSRYTVVASREQLIETLSDLTVLLHAASLEILLLDASAHLRDRFGGDAARVAFENALEIVPRSAMIRSDLLMTMWSMLRDANHTDRQQLLEHIADVFPSLDLDVVDAGAVDTIVLAYSTALTFLPGRLADRDAFVRSVAVSRVTTQAVASRIEYLLSAPVPELGRII